MIRNLIKTSLATITLAATSIATGTLNAYASGGTTEASSALTKVSSTANSGKSVNDLTDTIISTMLFIVGILSVAMIIYSGIRYVTAHGDKSQIESAKNTLIYSVVGLVISITAYAIVNWVMSRF